ncbi:MAG: DUF4032 domain-containing protein [Anaerolineae bacterium]
MNDDSSTEIKSMVADPGGLAQRGRSRVTRDFDRAHRWAFFQDLLSALRYHPVDLLPFEAVHEKLHLGHKSYRGLQEIPLDAIVGSVGRYEDFTRSFMPRKTHTRPRWENIETLAEHGGWPPIEVYKVSDTYFVRDGNHRVSVARQMGMDTIEAEVWEYLTRVPLEADDDLDDLIVRAEYLEFLDDTRLDQLRPQQRIILTLPGGYWELEESIAVHRHWELVDKERDLTWPEAVADWYDHIYLPLVEKIQQEDILAYFPGRTEADLVVWVLRHWEKLERDFGGEDIPPGEVVENFAERTRANVPRRLLAWFERRLMGKPVGDGD